MMLCRWEKLPEEMRTLEVYDYYVILQGRKTSLFFKRVSDIVLSFIMLIILTPLFLLLAVIIKADSPGPVFFRQVRVTQYGRTFRIHKFRTMFVGSYKGAPVTLNGDARITRVGRFIRKYKIDELCQLIDVLAGNMTLVGTRPEVPHFTEKYTPEMMATLLLPAGITCLASIYFKDEAELLKSASDVDKVYAEEILPVKMYYNLKEIKEFSLWNDIKVIAATALAILGKEYKGDYTVPVKETIEVASEENRLAVR